MDDREIRLGSGRALAWREFGDPLGRPALYFHGFPGSRLEGRFVHDAARKHRVRLLALDRPSREPSG